jgi:Fe-S-cluster-containing hydrogenase component 2
MMASVEIDIRSCDRSPACPARRVCPEGAIAPEAGGSYPGANGYVVDEDKCAGCGVCAGVCPRGAVRMS